MFIWLRRAQLGKCTDFNTLIMMGGGGEGGNHCTLYKYLIK